METGNPKQLAILGIVAVGAVGFLFTRLAGKAAPALAQAVALAKTQAKSPSIGALTVGRDPFSHPKLAPKDVKPAETPVSSFGMAKPAGMMPTGMMGAPAHIGPLPAAGDVPLTPPPSITAEPLDPGKPAQAEKPEAAPAPERTMIGLEAIAGASETVAFLTVGGGESQPFHPHDRVKGAIRLLRVQDGSVVLSGPKGETTLDVGERKSL